jgi:hypothetical protein
MPPLGLARSGPHFDGSRADHTRPLHSPMGDQPLPFLGRTIQQASSQPVQGWALVHAGGTRNPRGDTWRQRATIPLPGDDPASWEPSLSPRCFCRDPQSHWTLGVLTQAWLQGSSSGHKRNCKPSGPMGRQGQWCQVPSSQLTT